MAADFIESVTKSKSVGVYIHPCRVIPPVSGVGRHIIGMLNELKRSDQFSTELLFARDQASDVESDRFPDALRSLKRNALAAPERWMEWGWKSIGLPRFENVFGKFDIVYSPAETCFPRGKTPRLITLHDIYPLDPIYPYYRSSVSAKKQFASWSYWVPRAFATATAILTVSEFSKKRMCELLGVDPCSVHVVGNGIDTIFFEAAGKNLEHCVRPIPNPYAIVIGGLCDRKGAKDILAVAAYLRTKAPDLRIVVVGKCEDHWSRRAMEHPNVVLVGPQTDEAMVGFIRAAECTLFLSYYEGFGIPIVESMAIGTPVVASNGTSLPEVQGGVGGSFSVEDSGAIGDWIKWIASSPSDRQAIIEKGKLRAQAFTWRACVQRLRSVFETVSR